MNEVSIVPTWQDSATKRCGFDVSTVGGTAQLTIDMASPGLMRLGAVLPSGRSYSAEIEDELAAFGLEAGRRGRARGPSSHGGGIRDEVFQARGDGGELAMSVLDAIDGWRK